MKRLGLGLIVGLSLAVTQTSVQVDITGTWSAVFLNSEPEFSQATIDRQFFVDLKTDGNKITGIVRNMCGTNAIESGVINGDQFSFSARGRECIANPRHLYEGLVRDSVISLTLRVVYRGEDEATATRFKYEAKRPAN
jgi:hypothetical protein